ncbi:T9SS type A sorting domain-containing protein [Chryseolinea sp. T2]|uniref:T9SS type A sorting domain-containing protein n=1 Tax=Chryseolinea sp. T2 TaxID=3129255 RepID=UPI003077790C
MRSRNRKKIIREDAVKVCRYVVIILSLMMPTDVRSQDPNAPGGVFSLTGTSNLTGWFEARDMDGDDVFTDNPANGAAVSAWSDKSSSANNLSQSTATSRPVYNTTGTYPAVNFTFNSVTAGQSDFMTFATASHFVPGSAYFVLLPSDPGANLQDHILLDDANRSLRLEQFSNTGNMGYTRYGVSDYATAQATTYGSYTIVSYHKSSANNNVIIRQNNASATLNIASSADGIPLTRLGKGSTVEGANYNCVEVLVYSTLLNSTQMVILDNYLSSKYGNISIASDQYGMDVVANGNHDFDVAGIGRVSGADNHQDSQSSIVRINTPSNINNGEYLFWGHDNGALSPQTTDLPATIQARFTRTWGVSELSGDVGTVSILFDMAGLGPVTNTDLRLLIDANNNGVFNEASTTVTAGATAVTISGTTYYQFAGVNLASSTRFTLGTINKSQTPLPVELFSFSARVENNDVNIYWKTASEVNNDYFEVQRSTNGKFFNKIDSVKGAVNSNITKEYKTTDRFPPTGLTYYRLKQVDLDGQYAYSPVVHIEIPRRELTVDVYPSFTRANTFVNVALSNFKRDETLYGAIYTLMDLQGRTMYLPSEKISDTHARIGIPADCSAGVYILKIIFNNNTYTKRITIL